MRASFPAALSGLRIPLFPPPPPSLAFIYFFALSSHSIRFTLSLPPLFTILFLLPPCLCMLPPLIIFSLARNMNILELRSLKGTMNRPPKWNYTPFPQPQKRDFPEWWAHRRHAGVAFYSFRVVVSCFYVRSVIFPLILLAEFRNQQVEEWATNMLPHSVHLTAGLEKFSRAAHVTTVCVIKGKRKAGAHWHKSADDFGSFFFPQFLNWANKN